MTGRQILARTILLVGLVLLGFAIRGQESSRDGADLRPRGKALQIGLASASLAHSFTLAVPIGGTTLPPRCAPGYPLLAAPLLAVTGGDASHAFELAFLFGLVTILVTGLAGGILGGWPGSLIAGGLVALSPLAIDGSLRALPDGV
ncbi:MAG: hypothetical protein V2A76_14095, partial [Planctomycetota bacterium]